MERKYLDTIQRIINQKITKYMKADGYFLVADSSDRSMLPDQIFKCPLREGTTEIWVEAKYTDLSITNSDFQVELARYFIEYMHREKSERFDLFFFIRNCQNCIDIFDFHLFNFKLDNTFSFVGSVTQSNLLRTVNGKITFP